MNEAGSRGGKPSADPETWDSFKAQMEVFPVYKRKDRGSLKEDGNVNCSTFYVLLWHLLWALCMFPHLILAKYYE